MLPKITPTDLTALLEHLDALVVVIDMQTFTVLYINQYGRKRWGNLTGQICWQTIQACQSGPCAFCSSTQLLAADGTPTAGVVWEIFNTRVQRWFECRDKAIYWPNGRMVRLEIATDISDRKQAEARLNQQQQLLVSQGKEQSLSRMAGAVAHNFNNLLASIQGNLDLAAMKLPGHAEVQPYLQQALATVNQAAEINRRLMAGTGHYPYTSADMLDLAAACRAIVQRLQVKLPPTITLNTRFPQKGPYLPIHWEALSQVVTSLVVNACESLENRSGSIALQIDCQPADQICRADVRPANWQPQADSYACITVTDNGCGIPPDSLNDIFDPFYSTRQLGRGLGLSVALGAVKAHGGALAVTSKPHRGTRCQVYWPCNPNVKATVAAE